MKNRFRTRMGDGELVPLSTADVSEVVDLEEWYRNHQHDFSVLTTAHYTEIIKYCGQKKQALIQGGNGTKSQVALFS